MNLEGTKHEKAVLVVVAYIIGLTSGFIGFGLSTLNSEKVIDPAYIENDIVIRDNYTPPTQNPPTAADDESQNNTNEEMQNEDINIDSNPVTYTDGRLYANVNDQRFVLSLRNDVMPTDNVEGFATQGIHKDLPAFSPSVDGRFVYFCEQQTDTPECTHFVFDTTSNLIQFVSMDGKKVITSNDIAKATTWTEDGKLTIGEFTSIAVDEPWKVTVTE